MTPAILDITVIVILLLSTIIAWYRGIIREVFTIIGIGVSAFGAYALGPTLVPQFNRWFGVPEDGGEKAAAAVTRGVDAGVASADAVEAAQAKSELILGILAPGHAALAVSYAAAFLAIFLIMSLLSFFISRSVQEMGLGLVDKGVGAVFGFARGFLLLFIPYVIIIAAQGPDDLPDWAKKSMTVPVFNDTYAYADRNFDFGDTIDKIGISVIERLEKIRPEKARKALTEKAISAEEAELKESLKREEAEREREQEEEAR